VLKNSTRRTIFKFILRQFNPYVNLVAVYDKYLDRWLRSTFLQVYFMAIAAPIALF